MATNVTGRLDEQIALVDKGIIDLKARCDAEVARLESIKAALQGVRRIITPEIEAAVATLEKLGLLPGR